MAPLFALAPEDEPAAIEPGEPTAPAAPAGDHRAALVQALTRGVERAFAAGDTRAALLALDTVRALVGDAAEGPAAPVVDLGAERRRRER